MNGSEIKGSAKCVWDFKEEIIVRTSRSDAAEIREGKDREKTNGFVLREATGYLQENCFS